MATIQTAADWQKQWFEIADATYLNTAAHAAIPRVALRRVRWAPQSAGLTAVSPRGPRKRPPSFIRSYRGNMLSWLCERVRSASHPICSIQSGTSTA